MKKYLINGAMALIVGGFIVSCSHDDIEQTGTVEQMSKSFDEMFTELYGPIAENHNWGFETVLAEAGVDEASEAAGTRTTEKEDHNITAMGLTKPTLKDGEAAYVMKWFQENSGENSVGVNTNKFFIIFVGNNTSVNVRHHEWDENYYNNNKNNGATSNFYDRYDTQNVFLDKLMIGGEHINDWNANGGVTELVYDLTASSFSAHNSYCDIWTTKWKLARITYGGEEGWYVGISAYGKKSIGTYTLLKEGQEGYDASKTDERADYTDYDRPEYYDDYVFKIVPADANPGTDNPGTDNPGTETPGTETPVRDDPYNEYKSTTTTTYRQIVDLGRVFCEDIATAQMSVKEDIDYNDIVFDARVWKYWNETVITDNGSTSTYGPSNIMYQYDISLLATGGTIEELVNNTDVHNAFGVGMTFMVNTWMPNSTVYGQYNTKPMEAKDFSYTTYVSPGSDAGISSIPISVKYKGKNILALNEKTSGAPYKLCLPVGTLWPVERVNIRDAYNNFSSYVSSPSNKFYEDNITYGNLYTQAPTSSIQADMNNGLTKGHKETVNTTTSSSYVTVVWSGSETADNAAITLRNYNFSAGQTLRFSGSGTIRVLDSSNQEIFDSFSMSGGYRDVYISSSSQAAALNGGSIIINGSNFRLDKIVVL